jgi:hypothetical protein
LPRTPHSNSPSGNTNNMTNAREEGPNM